MYRTVGPILMALMALASTAWAQDPPGKAIFEAAAAPVTALTATVENAPPSPGRTGPAGSATTR
jgi:hypothetical protein